ncbi:hypothetical protein [Streptomyces sp. LaPpAH-108]|uniref:hypothetical protein n=1 Tax=Streptomyces sp. LaPpAH-108 TaxID=1155714 RepID=UPI000362C04D|nr:hypothetical protein [Streptomyces sp. LaPpAH-108]
MHVEDHGDQIVITASRKEFFLVEALMMEALETGDDRDFQTRVGATKDQVRDLLDGLPDLPLGGGSQMS